MKAERVTQVVVVRGKRKFLCAGIGLLCRSDTSWAGELQEWLAGFRNWRSNGERGTSEQRASRFRLRDSLYCPGEGATAKLCQTVHAEQEIRP